MDFGKIAVFFQCINMWVFLFSTAYLILFPKQFNMILLMSFTSLGRFIPRYFEAIVNRDVFITTLWACMLGLHVWKHFDFCKLTLYSASLWKLLIISSFLVIFLAYLIYNITTPTNRESLTSFFPLIAYSCYIALASMSSIILKRKGDSKQLCLIVTLILKEFIRGFLHSRWCCLWVSHIATLLC